MRAMYLEQSRPIASSPLRYREDVPIPVPGSGQVRIRVEYCAICRTDLHIIEADLPEKKRPIIPGHQILGTIDRVGENCHHLKTGQRVGVAWLHGTCGQCRYCLNGKENLCPRGIFTGYGVDGGYAEYALAREAFTYPIPDSIDDLTSAPLLCAGIIGYRALNRCRLPVRGKLGIVGFGSSAHIVSQLAANRGAEIYVATRGEAHQALARKLGAVWVGERPADIPTLLDSAILFAPAGELVPEILERLDHGGTLAIAGIHLSAMPPLDYQHHLFFEKDVRSVTANTRLDGYALFREAAAGRIAVHTKRYRLTEANQALQDLKADRIQGTGILVISD